MSTLILRSLRAHRSRLILTIVAVSLSVSFVTGSFVLADSLRAVFGDVSAEIYNGVDAEIRAGEGTFDTIATGDRFDQTDLDGVEGIDGIAEVVPVLGGENIVFSVGADGQVLRQTGPPTLTFSTFGDSAASPFTIVSGHAPGSGEVMLDTAQARTLGVTDGDSVTVATPAGTEEFTLSGTVTFGEFESGVSPYFLLFDLPTMQHVLAAPGLVDSASLTLVDGVALDEVSVALAARLPDSLMVVDQAGLVSEQNSEFGEVIDMIRTALLVFAAITLFVSMFVIANTFAVMVGQQRRQIGLLRAVGARTGQAMTIVVAEAALVGLIASAVGVLGGLGIAEAIKALVEAVTSGGFPEGPTQVLPRTIIAAVVVGVGVTTVSALIPARRAGRVAPLEAMSNTTGRSATPNTTTARLLAATLGRLGPAGRLAASGVARNPRRVLTTSASMIVGLALISSMAVLAASYRSTIDDSVGAGLHADVVVTGADGVPVPYAAIDDIAAMSGIDGATAYGSTHVLHDGEVAGIAGLSTSIGEPLVVVDALVGETGPLEAGSAYVASSFARNEDLTVGDRMHVEFSDGFVADLTVQAVVDSTLIDSPIIVDRDLIAAHARNADADLGAIRFADGVDPVAGLATIKEALGTFPQLDAVSVEDYTAGRQAQADQLLVLANGLLALTVLVALTGIANTVALSLVERRAELGLLRAVGMSRRQVRHMVRLEALTLSSVGAITGTAIGIGVALAAIPMLPDSFVATTSLPAGSLVAYAIVGVAFGVAAAALPARRAARLDVLDAVVAP